MPQTTDRAPARPCPATGTKPHPPLSRALCILCACLASLLVVGCSDLGNYDERSVTRQAEGYYAEKDRAAQIAETARSESDPAVAEQDGGEQQ